MTTESNVVDATNDEDKLADANSAAKMEMTGQSLEEQLRYLKEINSELIKTRDAAKRKARELEKESESHKTLAATLKEKLVSRVVTDSLKAELAKAGALSVDTALKLVDRSKLVLSDDFELDTKSVESLVEELKTTDSILFKPVTATDEKEGKPIKQPSIARAGEAANSETAYEVAMRAAKNQKQIEAIMRQFGKI